MPQHSSKTLEAVTRVSRCSSAVVHEEMKHGVYGLATIACVAPWVGLFGTILGIVNSFPGVEGEKTSLMAALAKRLSESMWPTAFGLLVGIIALWCYRYLESRLETFDHEMESASRELLNQLARFRGKFSADPAVERLSDGLMFGEKSLAELSRDEEFWRRCMFLTGTVLVMAWMDRCGVTSVTTRFLCINPWRPHAYSFRFCSASHA
jgi:MotA/TolQ/ExbB proton channel family